MNLRKFITIFSLAILALGAGILISKAYLRSKTDSSSSGQSLSLESASSTIASQTAEASTTSANVPAHKNIILTQADDTTTVTLGVGDEVLLKLSSMNWTVSVTNTSVLKSIKNPGNIEGIQGIFTANEPGKTDITAEGRPQCNAGEMCAQYIVSYTIHVIVAAQ